MTKEEAKGKEYAMTYRDAEEYAKKMTYRDAVHNALQGKCIPYRKATLIKLYKLLEVLEQESCEDCIDRESEDIKMLQKRAYLEGFHEASKMLVKQEPLTDVLDKIKADVEQYQADCNLSCSADANCRTCDNITFGSIYRIIDKYRKESEERNESC